MTYKERIDDLEELEQYYNAVDFLGKNRRFFSDIIVYRKEMIEKDKNFIREGLRYIKPRISKRILLAFFALSVALLSVFMLSTDLTLASLKQYSFTELMALFENVFTIPKDEGLKSFLNVIVIMVLSCGGVVWAGLTIYFLFKLILLPFEAIYYLTEKNKTRKYLKLQDKRLSIEQARSFLLKTNAAIKTAKGEINALCEKHNIDVRLRNRENIPYIKELMLCNQEKDPTVEQICNYIISKDKIKPSVDDDTWCRLLLAYDKDYTYYQKENPWLEKYKLKKQKIWKAVTFIPALPIWFIIWQIKMCFALLGINKESIERKKYSTNFNPENQLSRFDDTNETESTMGEHQYTFVDGKGNLCESGGVFYDARGNLCEWGNPFYDGKGNYCEWGSPFYDARGNYCDGSSPFYDWQGNLINPKD